MQTFFGREGPVQRAKGAWAPPSANNDKRCTICCGPMSYPEFSMATISPTLEGFRAAFRRPSFTLAEISWRWVTGAVGACVFVFGLFEYLDTLPVNGGELLFLRSRQPYLVAQALAHILRGSLIRVVLAGLIAAWLLSLLWMFAGAAGRIATVQALLDYFRHDAARLLAARENVVASEAIESAAIAEPRPDSPSQTPRTQSPFTPLLRLNFLRAATALAASVGFVGAAILTSFVSPDTNPRPGLAFLLFLPLAGMIALAWSSLNWLLSLAGVFAVRDAADTMGAISAAVGFCRNRAGAVAAVSTWTGLAHLAAWVGATTVVTVPIGLAGLLPWRLVVLGMLMVTLGYFALADWLYMARLAGYVCIAETPDELLRPAPLPPSPTPSLDLPRAPVAWLQTSIVQTSIDRDELILSDVVPPPEEPQPSN
jgi:hypothetical protein